MIANVKITYKNIDRPTDNQKIIDSTSLFSWDSSHCLRYFVLPNAEVHFKVCINLVLGSISQSNKYPSLSGVAVLDLTTHGSTGSFFVDPFYGF